MPNWKKVIISGSNAELSSVTVNETAATTNTGKFAVLDNGTLKYRTASQFKSDLNIQSSSGTVTSITAGDGLTGGTITDSGTITVDSSVVRDTDLNGYVAKTGDENIGGIKTFTSDLNISNVTLSNQENTTVVTGTETVATVSATDNDAAFFDYVIKNGTNLRSGTVYTVHDGTNIQFTETSTNDLGDTTDVELSATLSGGNIVLQATVASDNWSIRTLVRGI